MSVGKRILETTRLNKYVQISEKFDLAQVNIL